MSTGSLHLEDSSPIRSPSNHIVQFYDDDQILVESIGRFVSPGLAAGGNAIVVATAAHRVALQQELAARGFDFEKLTHAGRVSVSDARSLLEQLLVEGWPDRGLFHQVVGELVQKSIASSPAKNQLAIFGEMVALLFADGKPDAAIRLEQLWNELAEVKGFSLLCAYPMNVFRRKEDRKLFFSICGEHAQVNPTENYPARGTEQQRQRHVAMLEQKTRALENEIRLGQERVLLLQNQIEGGTWEMDLTDETVSLSSRAARILNSSSVRIRLPELLAFMHYSGDRDRFLESVRRISTRRCKEFVTEFRFRANGNAGTRILCIRGKAVYNGGQPLVLGVITDVTPK